MKKRYKKIYIEITNVCNLSCSFCPKSKRSPHFMSVLEFERALTQAYAMGDFINLHVMGEPLLHPKLPEFLSLCHEIGAPVNITTNATLIHKLSDTLLNAPALNKVNISLHSFEANECDLSLNEYLHNIINFAKLASKNTKIITAMRLWNQDNGDNTAENSLNSQIFNMLQQEFSPDFSIEEKFKTQKAVILGERLFLNTDKKFDWPDITLDKISDSGFCYGLRDHVAILCDLSVVPCCLDHDGDIILGNLATDELSKIVASPRATAIYKGFSGRKAVEPLCQKCGYIKRFIKTN